MHSRNYRSGFFFGSLSFISTVGLGFVSTVITARLYGVAVIGEFALVWAPVAVMWTLSSVKEQQALIKEITGLPARHPRVTQLFAVVFGFSGLLTISVALLDAVGSYFVFSGPLNQPQLFAPALVSIVGYTLIINTGWNLDSILSAFVAGKRLFWVRLHETVGFIVIAVVIGLEWKSVWGLVIATLGGAGSALIHRVFATRDFVRPRITREEFGLGLDSLPELLRFGLRATPGQIAQGISQQGGIWAVGIVAPVAVVGAYSRALVIPKSLQQASMRITEVLYPTLVGRHTTGDREGFDRALIDSIRYEVIGLLLVAAVIGGAAHSVLGIFGPGFDTATPALVLLMLYPVLASITVAQTQALWAVDRPGLTSLAAIARLACTIGLLFALTPSSHVVGPALALLAGFVTAAAISGIGLKNHLSQPSHKVWSWRERFVLCLCYGAGFGAAHLLQNVAAPIVGIPLGLLGGSIAFLILLFAAGVNGRDRQRFREVVAWGRRRVGSQALGASVEMPDG